MAQFTNCGLCSLLRDVGSSREPVLNPANLSCQQLSRSSDWVIVGACCCGARTELTETDGDFLALSFTTCATVATEDSTRICASLVEWDFLPGLFEGQEVSVCGDGYALLLRRWVDENQGPWNSFRVTQPNNSDDLEFDFCDSLDGVESRGDSEEGSEVEDGEAFGQGGFGDLELELALALTLKAFGI